MSNHVDLGCTDTSAASAFKKAQLLLTPIERRKAMVLLFLMVVGMLLETLGIGLIIPSVTLMMQDNFLSRHSELSFISEVLSSMSQEKLISLAMLSLVGVYFLKNLFLAFLAWRQADFTFNVQADISQRLFANYLRQPYTFHLQRNSAELVRNTTGEIGVFATFLTSGMTLISELLVIFGILTLLMLIQPLGTSVIVAILATTAWGFHYITRERISRWGGERQLHNGLRLKHLLQGLGSAKDVKLFGREDDFLNQFRKNNVRTFHVMRNQFVVGDFPRLLFELLAVVGLATLVIIMLANNHSMNSIIPTLGLFAAAAFRLMPSVNRTLRSVQQFRYSLPVINTLYEELCVLAPKPIKKETGSYINFNGALKLVDITYHYCGTEKPALNGICMEVEKGKSVGIIGASGAGKSTLIDVITGLLEPSSGMIMLDGKDLLPDLRRWQDQIGYVPQSIYLTDDTLKRNIAFGLAEEEIDDESVMRALSAAKLDEFVNQLPNGLGTIVGEHGVRLSGGQIQRIGIARALYHDPEVLVLDEATSALDEKTEAEVMEAVLSLQGRKTMLIIAHRLSTVEQCDLLYKLEKGKVVAYGNPKDIINA